MVDRSMPFPLDDPMISFVESGQGPRLFCAPFSHTALVAGKGSDLSREIRLDRAARDEVPVYRRRGGGCTVFLDPETIVVSVAFPVSGFGGIQTLFNACTNWLIRGLNRTTGLVLYTDGVSDLVLENRKIGGSCFYRSKGLAFFSASILGSTNLDLMDEYLPIPPREPVYRRGRNHRDFLTRLSDHLGAINSQELSTGLKNNLYLENPVLRARAA
ncbi:lipoate--protein ligase family protein [Desulfospira joergensenii]|uniref:lipoate--protein ligase family protein n=1 Tax=Desulfospira joergensenii TaxID=53329 RepID=UPI0003B475F8|nr:hypothetical protein [Desulfospira joergensenii]